MTDYTELVKALRCCGSTSADCTVCPLDKYTFGMCAEKLLMDAAAAIEALQAKYEDERQTNIILTGQVYELNEKVAELKAAQPHWVSVEEPPKGNGAFAACCVYDGKIYWFKAIFLDGKWLREMDGVELPVNYWMEIPEPPKEVQDGTE